MHTRNWLDSVYDELREIAAAHLRHERPGHTLQTTALVHEAYLRLADRSDGHPRNKTDFCAAAIQAIRRVLVDHARARKRLKRGGPDARRIELDSGDLLLAPAALDLCDLNEALEELERVEPRLARVVELRYFCGLTDDEVATTLSCTRRTVLRDWRFARAWLAERLEPGGLPHVRSAATRGAP